MKIGSSNRTRRVAKMTTPTRAARALLVACALTGSAACSGSIDGSVGGSPSDPDDVGMPGPRAPGGKPSGETPAPASPKPDVGGGSPGPAAGALGTRPLVRLSGVELANTLKDLVGSAIAVRLPSDPIGESTYASPSDIGGVERDLVERAADAAAAANAAQTPPCATGTAPRTCASDFIKSFGKRAFRRPVRDKELADLLALFDKLGQAPAGYAYADAVRTVTSAMLQSPQFLYHWEIGAAKPEKEGALVRLDGWEVASRLSYLLWGTMPDAALFAAAEAGELSSPAQIEAQARRLLKDKDRAKHLATNLFGQWLTLSAIPELKKDAKVLATFDDALKTAIAGEAERFLAKAVIEDGGFGAVLTGRDSFVNAATAKLYGLAGVTGDALVAKTLPPERAGLFTQLAFLNVKALPQESSPVRRGKLVLERLLCRRVEPAPPELDVKPPQIPDTAQTREAYEMHAKNPSCAGCHTTMDALGFAFEHFDAVGRFRAKEAGRDIDSSGKVTLDGAEIAFKDATELMAALGKSAEVRGCAAAQVMRYGIGRKLDTGDDPGLAKAREAFATGDLRELVVALVKSDSFRMRSPAQGEVIE